MLNRLICVAAALALLLPVGCGEAQPAIHCDEPVHDFGSRKDTEVVVHRFRLRNTGNATLRILDVKASCGCTAAVPTANEIAPGGETFVEAHFTLKGRRGKQNISLTVESNDPSQARYVLRLTGAIVTELDFDPRYVSFAQLHTEAVSTQTVSMTSSRPAIRITQAVSDNPAFRADIVADGRGLAITSVPPLTPGLIHAAIEIETDHPDSLTHRLPVSAAVVGDIVVIPRVLMLRRGVAGPQRRALLLRATGPHPLAVSRVDVPLPGIGVTTRRLDDGSFSITLDRLEPNPELDNQVITIQTGVPSSPEVTVPIQLLP